MKGNEPVNANCHKHGHVCGVDATLNLGAIAQLGERRFCKAEVIGSFPISSINYFL